MMEENEIKIKLNDQQYKMNILKGGRLKQAKVKTTHGLNKRFRNKKNKNKPIRKVHEPKPYLKPNLRTNLTLIYLITVFKT